MYVCICNGLNEKRVDQAIERGAGTAKEVYFACGVKPKCGKCKPEIHAMIEQRLNAYAENRHATATTALSVAAISM